MLNVRAKMWFFWSQPAEIHSLGSRISSRKNNSNIYIYIYIHIWSFKCVWHWQHHKQTACNLHPWPGIFDAGERARPHTKCSGFPLCVHANPDAPAFTHNWCVSKVYVFGRCCKIFWTGLSNRFDFQGLGALVAIFSPPKYFRYNVVAVGEQKRTWCNSPSHATQYVIFLKENHIWYVISGNTWARTSEPTHFLFHWS